MVEDALWPQVEPSCGPMPHLSCIWLSRLCCIHNPLAFLHYRDFFWKVQPGHWYGTHYIGTGQFIRADGRGGVDPIIY